MKTNSGDATVFCPIEGDNVLVSEACLDCPYWDGSRCEALARSAKRSTKKSRNRERRTSFTTRGGRARVPLVGEKWPYGRAAHEEGIGGESGPTPSKPDYTGADRFFQEPEVEAESDDEDDDEQVFDRGVAGLERGAEDYGTTPFSMRELVARVRAVLRRSAADDAEEIEGTMTKGGVVLDAEKHEATVLGRPLELSPKEFDLLAYLMRHAGRVRPRQEILAAVWGESEYVDERTVDVHVRWLRKKIEADPGNPQRIVTVRGVGYKFVDGE